MKSKANIVIWRTKEKVLVPDSEGWTYTGEEPYYTSRPVYFNHELDIVDGDICLLEDGYQNKNYFKIKPYSGNSNPDYFRGKFHYYFTKLSNLEILAHQLPIYD